MTTCPAGENTILDSELRTYGRRAARRPANRLGATELLGYTAAAGGLAFAGGDAVGGIIHSTSGITASFSVAATVNPNSIMAWDIDGDGTPDAQLWARPLGASDLVAELVGPGGNFSIGVDGTVGSYAAARTFAPGATVGAGGISFNLYGILGSFRAGGTFGRFIGTSAYAGFMFEPSGPKPGGSSTPWYGWAKIRVEGEEGAGITATLFEWAYDDCGDPIQVGATSGGRTCTGVVPAPGTPLLALLGLGALGVQTYRRRREEGLERVAAEQTNPAGQPLAPSGYARIETEQPSI